MAQDNNTSKGGFFGKLKDTFSTEIKIGNYTFKDGSVYTGCLLYTSECIGNIPSPFVPAVISFRNCYGMAETSSC